MAYFTKPSGKNYVQLNDRNISVEQIGKDVKKNYAKQTNEMYNFLN